MTRTRKFLLLGTLFAAAAPAFGQTPVPVTSIPDFSGMWAHASIPGFEPLASGPTSLINRSRRNGISNLLQLNGDYTNPILKPQAADIVKQHAELSLAGIGYPTPRNQCWPGGVPFVLPTNGMQMFQQPDRITILYAVNHQVRHVRMNETHPQRVTPSWYGDSVGHYEGDTLVSDTIGIKTDRKYAMIDLFGTPYTDRLHMVERYRLRDYDDVKDALERNNKENWLFQGDVWSRQRAGKFLQLHVTIEDGGVFTTPWTATITYAAGPSGITEGVCSENRMEYYNNKEADVPRAEKPDF